MIYQAPDNLNHLLTGPTRNSRPEDGYFGNKGLVLWWLSGFDVLLTVLVMGMVGKGERIHCLGSRRLCFEVILNCFDDGNGWKRDYQKRERMNGLGGRRVRVVLGDNYGTTSPPMGTHRTLVSPQIWFSNFLKIQNWANLPLALSLKENPFLNATYKVETELMWNVQVFFSLYFGGCQFGERKQRDIPMRITLREKLWWIIPTLENTFCQYFLSSIFKHLHIASTKAGLF